MVADLDGAAATAADPVLVVSAARTPIGAFQGALAGFSAPELGGIAIAAACARAGLGARTVDEVLMGCVLPAGLGQAPARQAALIAGLDPSSACTTVNKVCGSGMKSLMLAHDLLCAGSAKVCVAGGMESMSNAPYLLPKVRAGLRLGHGAVLDHKFLDGLEDAYQDRGRLMGAFAEDCARERGCTREAQDAFARRSTLRAQTALASGAFDWETAAVAPRGRDAGLNHDEQPGRARLDRIADLKPAFRPDGTITAGNASSISDGAAALVLMRASTARQHGCVPLARIVGHASHAGAPAGFPIAPVAAIRRLLSALDWPVDTVDLWEINEAFAVVALAAIDLLQLDPERVNVHGGACALGHPIGASGARIVVSLLGALRARQLRRGVAAVCIGGGEATALALEMIPDHAGSGT